MGAVGGPGFLSSSLSGGPNPGFPADSEQMRESGRGPWAAPVLSWLWLPLVPSHRSYLRLARALHCWRSGSGPPGYPAWLWKEQNREGTGPGRSRPAASGERSSFKPWHQHVRGQVAAGMKSY